MTIDKKPPESPAEPSPAVEGAGPSRPRIASQSVFARLPETLDFPSPLRLREADSDIEALLDAAPEPEAGRDHQVEDRYRLVDTVGVGGMGKVYLARDRDLERHVALKVVLKEDRAHWRRFLDEARIVGQLEHPNIVAIHDIGVTADDQRPYATMRFVSGKDLREILEAVAANDPQAEKVYSLLRLLQIFLQVTQAIGYAHDRGVAHRDLKPQNVMIGSHGEVQVVDWGLARVLERSDVSVSGGESLTREGFVVGTPEYMAPELIAGGDANELSDVYSLGVVLYEILTLECPYRGRTAVEVLGKVLKEEPPRPQLVAPERVTSVELEEICLKAMHRDPTVRYQSMTELHDAVQGWIESEADRALRRRRADDFADRAEADLDRYLGLKRETEELAERIEATRQMLNPWQTRDEKAELFELEDELAETRRKLALVASDVMMDVAAAFGQQDGHPRARLVFADFMWSRLSEAEDAHDREQVAYSARLVEAFHDGRYDHQLRGVGSIELTSDPDGADVWLYELEERNLNLVPVRGRRLGETPLRPVEVEMGSYLLVLKAEGRRDTTYPVWISRNREWKGRVLMFSDDEIGPGFVHVPRGPFLCGGDPTLVGWSLPKSEPTLDDYFVSVHPVTLGEYLQFLNDLEASESGAGARHAPRFAMGIETFLVRTDDGAFALPPTDPQGNALGARQPVFGVTWHDANAYCAWRSERDGRSYRLPTELEWEKAARGVDGRGFPWGNRFDATLCNSLGSHPSRPRPVSVDLFPNDRSVYGVRGMAGNVRDWTASLVTQGEGETAIESSVIRGGGAEFAGTTEFEIMSRCAFRYLIPTMYALPAISFRLVTSPASG